RRLTEEGVAVGYPNIEQLLVAYYKDKTGKRAVTELPGNLEEILAGNTGVIQVTRVPSGAGYRLDRPQVDVSVWTLKTQRGLCSQIAQQVLDLTTRDLPGPRRHGGRSEERRAGKEGRYRGGMQQAQTRGC